MKPRHNEVLSVLKSKSVKVMNAHPAGLLFTRVSQSKLRSFQRGRLQIRILQPKNSF